MGMEGKMGKFLSRRSRVRSGRSRRKRCFNKELKRCLSKNMEGGLKSTEFERL